MQYPISKNGSICLLSSILLIWVEKHTVAQCRREWERASPQRDGTLNGGSEQKRNEITKSRQSFFFHTTMMLL
jgi:hypothetical protein